MTRIIAGLAAGSRLEVPGSGTRPTSDRVRESVFSALDAIDAIDGARVLDLYAGSGAFGLESLSRGARSAELVERAQGAAAVAERNAAAVAKPVGTTARVHRAAVDAFLRRATATYDLVFLDPPYDVGDDELAAALDALAPRLSPDAIVVVERSGRSPEPTWPTGLTRTREKRYGDTVLWWAEPAPSQPSTQPSPASQSR